ncbi:MAG: alpha-glucosidase/alpha-galactosidase [Spirochaetales bacterium]|nr:alpha-glucosidase/alpha-galactosidase [Spirochaetales bacterium]
MSTRPRITFLGAGSTIFLKNLIGDAFLFDTLSEAEIALYDIDENRLEESRIIIESLNNSMNLGRAVISTYLGVCNRRDALKNSDFVINAIQVGGYEPSTVIDFEIPKKYGLLQTIGDTLGIGGIFRTLRTVPVMLDIVSDMEDVCPDAIILNYANPMAMVTGAIQKTSEIQTVGLCHSVQICAPDLLKSLDMKAEKLRWKIAGINHMAWLLEIRDGDRDLYPEIKKRAAAKNKMHKHDDMIRFEMMKHFGYYITESSEHFAEYVPYWIRKDSPELIERYNIPLDEYPRRCIEQIRDWQSRKQALMAGEELEHEKTREYGADIMNAVLSDNPTCIHGNILNTDGYIPNLPSDAVVEVPCLVDGNGIQGVHSGKLPIQCAALNQTNINVQQLTIEAVLSRKKAAVYQAALLDPHTSGELNVEKIIQLCDELFDAHEEWLPEYN